DLWDGEPPEGAASTLKSHVSLLRKTLGPDRLVHKDGGYVLVVARGELDVGEFERRAAAGRDALRNGDRKAAADELGEALALWRGPALADVADTSWGRPEAVRLEEEKAATLESWLQARLELGDSHELIAPAESAVAEHPLREGLWAKLITALYLSGRQADALRAYQRLRDILGEELGINPSRQLVTLEGAILRQDLPLAASEPVERVKVLLGAGSGSGLDEASPGGRPPAGTGNLPRELTSFIPRPSELAEVSRLIDAPGLVTLTGTGGTGKTRLALRAAADAQRHCDAVWLCDLAPIEEPADVVRQLASTVGCSDRAGVELTRTVTQRLREGSNLVVLDNCEHLIDACAQLTAKLLGEAPALTVLATSRSPLGVPGEVVHRVPSMSVPAEESDGGDLMDFESVRLFAERAATQGSFSIEGNKRAVASICLRLDGIPLALELAAARLRTMSAGDIEQRLDDRFKLLTSGARTGPRRQQTLQFLIDWSYDLLDTPERLVFGRLAVFAGGFDLSAAESVAQSQEVERLAVLDTVASLVDKSLLQVDTSGMTARYRMLETVRAYAHTKLTESESEKARAAHAAHYLHLAEVAAPHFFGPDQLAWRARLEEDNDNLRLAFTTLIAAEDAAEESLRFGAAVSRFWNTRGDYGDEVDLLGSALERAGAKAPTPARAGALAAAGYLMFRRGQTARASAYLDEALEIARSLGSAWLQADALRTMAWVADRRGDQEAAVRLAAEAVTAATLSGELHLLARAYDVRAAANQGTDPVAARRDYAEALAYCRRAGDGLGQASALNNLGVLDLEQGDHEGARARFSEALGLAEGVRDAALIPFLEYGAGLSACLDGDFAAAEPAFVNALQAARRTGQRSLVAYALLGAASVQSCTGRERAGARLLGAALALFEELGEKPEAVETTLLDSTTASLRQGLGEAFEDVTAEGRYMPLTEIVQLAAVGL
ncbi:MAG TPA: BTAD domain-containing putative transcriptional regulator, partial [Acidimicrobiales bacterium]|nr:BTAD domain-containing putative transcriptional regulator [Acidimicrobiales bacterium]